MKTTPVIQNLVFQGGSVRGIAYLGALQAMTDAGIDFTRIKRIAGTSAGAITALLLSLGYSLDKLKVHLDNINFTDVLDGHSNFVQGRVLKSVDKINGGQNRFFATMPVATASPSLLTELSSEYGVFEGNYFLEWVQARLKEYTGDEDITFEELHALHLNNPARFKDLYVYGANISLGLSEQFSWETTPTVTIASALRISMSIPFVFKPFCVMKKNQFGSVLPAIDGYVYVDGGILDNYPIHTFDHARYQFDTEADKPLLNTQTLGFRLLDKTKIDFFKDNTTLPKTETDSLLQFSMAVFNTIKNKENSDHNFSSNRSRTVYIDTVGVNMLDFGLTDKQKKALILAGHSATTAFLTGVTPDYREAEKILANDEPIVHINPPQEEINTLDTTKGCVIC